MAEKYRFTQGTEPTDSQLSELMHEVAVEAKLKADAAQAKFKADLHNKFLVAKEQIVKIKSMRT